MFTQFCFEGRKIVTSLLYFKVLWESRVGNGVERSTALPCENQIQFAVRPMVLDILYEGPDFKMLFRFSGLFSRNVAPTNSNTYRMRKAFDQWHLMRKAFDFIAI